MASSRRLLALAPALALVLGAARPAAAEDEISPLPARMIAFGVAGQGIPVGGLGQGGGGPTLELAFGAGRWQYFVEGSLMWVGAGAAEGRVDGIMARAGVGARWIARAVELDASGGIELGLEAAAGLEQLWWLQGGRLTRPDLGAGVVWQVRMYRRPKLAIRFSVRAMFAPADDVLITACTGPCATRSAWVPGLMGGFGVAW